ncbi:MAG TPA: hypothetical protein VHE54_09220 [Puia sp.]|nr:hypothetical protein [Puia sp.]
MPVFKDLNQPEREQLLRFPVYLSLLAASKDCRLDGAEMHTAIKLTHIKTFSCDPVLADYYAEVDSNFEAVATKISNQLPADRDAREFAIKRELDKLEAILRKLDKRYAAILHESLRSYKDHVSRAHRNVLEYFLFPLPIGGITD